MQFRSMRLAVAHERKLHHARREQLAADIDLAPARRSPAGTRAKPIERSSVGENVPLVISPSPTRRHDDFLVTAQHAALLEHQADELARHAGAPSALRARRGR